MTQNGPVIMFNDLPRKAHLMIFGYLKQNERQLKRAVCVKWNNLITEDFPVELTITNSNFEKTFKCCNAKKATINGLTGEYNGKISFSESVKAIEFTGKVLSSNVINILKTCKNIETLIVDSPKEVLGIESHEAFGLSKLSTLEFRVRMDQETFTSDELILINTLQNIKFGALEKVLISVKLFGDWGEYGEDDNSSEGGGYNTGERSRVYLDTFTIASSSGVENNSRSQYPLYPSLVLAGSGIDSSQSAEDERYSVLEVPTNAGTDIDLGALINIAPEPSEAFSNAPSSSTGQQRPLQVDASAGMTEAGSQETAFSRIGVAEYEFASRLFQARLQLGIRNSTQDLETFLFEPSRTHRMMMMAGITGNIIGNTGIKTTAFFDLLKNNAEHLKVFTVKAKPDFLCFGNISTIPKDAISKIQLEDVEYSFGRSQRLCLEHIVLQAQTKLKSLKLHILDDMWNATMVAVDKSKATLAELDVKILSLSEDPIDLLALSSCNSLKVLKLFHFFEKENIHLLPVSLNKLVMNGPITKEHLKNFTIRLVNLTEFTLILNFQPSEKIDIFLFRQMITMPNIKRLVFIQTQIDVDAITSFCESNPQVTVVIQGPRQLKEPYTLTSSIQFVVIAITSSPEEAKLTSSNPFQLSSTI